MATETTARQAPRRSLLILLAVAVAALLVFWLWPSAVLAPAPSNGTRGRAATTAKGAPVTPASLVVRLDRLKQPPPQPEDLGRNPFRFQPKPPPPEPESSHERPHGTGARMTPGGSPTGTIAPAGPPAAPPIPLKFIGTLDSPQAGQIAALSDGRFVYHGKEGDIIEGRYRIVKIGVESIVMEYVDGRGRQTIPLRGQ
ncbi:MAG TPA: hypothetical protein VFX12_13365 [Vicinamibacterales bacterium]|nr:hypothetical protein [Vicinamibacterales bacterium]